MHRLFALGAAVILLAALATAPVAKEAKKAQTISALQAQEMLSQKAKDTFLVDVRTRAEYVLLGHPPEAYNVPWRFATSDFQVKDGRYNGGKAPITGYQLSSKPNPDFVGVVQSLFKPTDKLIVISTSGALGAEAADALANDGFKQVYNIRHGFLGDAYMPKEQNELAKKYSPVYGLRGHLNGWVHWNLPVSHEVDPRHIYPPDLKRMQKQK